MGVHFIRGCAVAVICAIGGASPSSAEPLFFTRDSILFFGGRLTSGNTDGALSIVGAHYESNYIVGGALRREFLKLGWGFTVGGEAGIAVMNRVVLNHAILRFGDDDRKTLDTIARLQADGIAFAGGARWRGVWVMRLSVANHSTSEAEAARTAEAIVAAWRAVK